MKHFTTDNNASIFSKTISVSFMIFFMISFWLFYEYWAEPKYWKNRWRLHRLMKSGRVKVIENKSNSALFDRELFTLLIDGEKYIMEIWCGKEMILSSGGYQRADYIGLFKGSLTTRWLNKRAIQMVRTLSDPQVIRDIKLRKLGIK